VMMAKLIFSSTTTSFYCHLWSIECILAESNY